MGEKGDKLTNSSVLATELLLEKLSPVTGISSKKMFGGHGIFHDGKMFGMVDSKGRCFLKTNDSNKHDYEELGAEKHSRMPYYLIPDAIINDNDKLLVWAQKSIDITK